ncbi:MAG: hypothetical protein NTW14_09995 [bacterium]|nr:hypothetical protein [bacterium]
MVKYVYGLLILFSATIALTAEPPTDKEGKLAQYRQGVWIMPDGSYAVYTDSHYFVLFASGDSTSANVYCGASQVRYHEKGMARKQVLRIRQNPGQELTFFKESAYLDAGKEQPMQIDPALFAPGSCNVKDGIIYDSITEIGSDYILLSSCNGDQEKIYRGGISVYLPAGGGEFYSYRIEK